MANAEIEISSLSQTLSSMSDSIENIKMSSVSERKAKTGGYLVQLFSSPVMARIISIEYDISTEFVIYEEGQWLKLGTH